MEQSLYTKVKVNNEIELCEISNPDCRHMIEKALLHQRISYYIRWPKPSLFRRNKNTCIICVNDYSKETAENVVRSLGKISHAEISESVPVNPKYFPPRNFVNFFRFLLTKYITPAIIIYVGCGEQRQPPGLLARGK